MAKNYVKASGKKIEWKYWVIINLSINVKDLERLPQNKGYVKLTIVEKKTDEYGNNITVFENEYKPISKDEVIPETNTDNDLPF